MDFKKPLSFEDFQEASMEAWQAQALKELKQDSLESLRWKTSGNIILDPYYDRSSPSYLGPFKNLINTPNEFSADPRWWENRQIITHTTDGDANTLILEALEGGADGVIIKENDNPIQFEKVLSGVKAEHCSISLITGNQNTASEFIRHLGTMAEPQQLSGDLIWENKESAIAFLQNIPPDSMPENFRFTGIQNISIEQQLACIAHHLEGIPASTKALAKKVLLNVTLDEDYFQNIANIRAARILLFQVLSAFKVPVSPEDLFIQAISPPYKNEKYGPQENMLKATTAAMAGITGGCNALVVIPEMEDSALTRRIARNISHILKEESYFGKVMDPAAGSYFLEHLTEQTCKNIWSRFQDLVSK